MSALPWPGAQVEEVLDWQSGVLSRAQARELGLSDAALRTRLRPGRWQRLAPGVYLAHSGPVPWLARVWAAHLYAGPDALLSHETAAALHGFAEQREPVHVTVPAGRKVRPQPGLVVHRARRLLDRRDGTVVPPRVTAAHAALDLADAAEDLTEALAAVARAVQREAATPAQLREALAQRPTVRWHAALQGALADLAAGAESPLELTYLRRVERAHRLPTGRRQRPVDDLGGTPGGAAVGAQRTDVAYEEFGTVVELDGATHFTPVAAWRDMARDNAATLRQERTLRYGYADVMGRPCEVAAQVAAVLTAAGWTGRPRRCGPGCPVRGDTGRRRSGR